jgi:hypothetical protein
MKEIQMQLDKHLNKLVYGSFPLEYITNTFPVPTDNIELPQTPMNFIELDNTLQYTTNNNQNG